MTFRKDGLLFIEQLITYCLMIVGCIALIPIDQLGFVPYLLLMFIIMIGLTPSIHNEFITINDNGIACRKKRKLIWEYRWENIINLKRSSRYRIPSIEIVTEVISSEITPYEYSQHYFQLGRKARKAIKMYYNRGQ